MHRIVPGTQRGSPGDKEVGTAVHCLSMSTGTCTFVALEDTTPLLSLPHLCCLVQVPLTCSSVPILPMVG